MAEYKFKKSDYISMVRQHKKKIAQMQQTIDQLNHDCELYKYLTNFKGMDIIKNIKWTKQKEGTAHTCVDERKCCQYPN